MKIRYLRLLCYWVMSLYIHSLHLLVLGLPSNNITGQPTALTPGCIFDSSQRFWPFCIALSIEKLGLQPSWYSFLWGINVNTWGIPCPSKLSMTVLSPERLNFSIVNVYRMNRMYVNVIGPKKRYLKMLPDYELTQLKSNKKGYKTEFFN